MTERPKTALVYSPHFLDHNAEIEHLEAPGRLLAVMEMLESTGILEELHSVSPRLAKRQEVAEVHSETYLSSLSRLGQRGGAYLDLDTYVSPCSEDVAYLAAGAVITAVDEVFSGRSSNAFCLVRPPGHHACHDHGMGFCLLDNLAIGARYAQTAKGITRIMIVDWDAHHGNGLQEAFLADENVLYVSLHQYPHYPGTGHQTELGKGDGQGFTINIPWPPGTGRESFQAAFEEIILPVGQSFGPELILIAAGYDSHWADPLSALKLTSADFSMMTAWLDGLAKGLAHGRLIASLEGGYDLKALALSVTGTIIRLADLEISLTESLAVPPPDPAARSQSRPILDQVKELLRPFWSLD